MPILPVQNVTLVHHATDVPMHSCLAKPGCLSQRIFKTFVNMIILYVFESTYGNNFQSIHHFLYYEHVGG